MPIYTFSCDECGSFDRTCLIDERETPAWCPTCGGTSRRVFDSPYLAVTPNGLGRAVETAGRICCLADGRSALPRAPQAVAMSAVGLVYVGAVLFINGVMLLGWLTPRETAPINLFVGALQVVTPTYLIFAAHGAPAAILAASGIYLFGFTYLWVGINGLKDYNQGLGWYSLFVTMCAIVFALNNFLSLDDPGFGVIWLLWAVLWFLFLLVLGLEIDRLTGVTGVFTVVVGFITAVATFQLLLGNWSGSVLEAIILAAIGLLSLVVGAATAARVMPRTKEAIA